MPNPNKPYSKINFRSRKTKDTRNLNLAKSSPYGGDVIIKSNKKIESPVNKGQRLSRGTQVSFRNRTDTYKSPDATAPSRSYTTSSTTPASKKFIPGDYNPPGKPTTDRATTPSLGKSLKESPAKVKARMDAQSKGQTSYDYKGKKEYSGRIETTPAKVISTTKKIPALTMKGESYSIPRKEVRIKKSMGPKDMGETRKFTSFQTPWTSTRKQTKGFTSNPSTGGKTTTIWKKNKNKIKRK